MKIRTNHSESKTSRRAFTLIEMMTSVAISMILIGGLMITYIDGNQCFVAMTNYQNLDKYSTSAMDILSREIRGASALVSYTTNSMVLTNATFGDTISISYSQTNGTLILTESGNTILGTAPITNLINCTNWYASYWMGVPNTNAFTNNIVFYAATNAASAKIVQMDWICTRSYLGNKINTESMQEAQIVLRNKTSN